MIKKIGCQTDSAEALIKKPETNSMILRSKITLHTPLKLTSQPSLAKPATGIIHDSFPGEKMINLPFFRMNIPCMVVLEKAAFISERGEKLKKSPLAMTYSPGRSPSKYHQR